MTPEMQKYIDLLESQLGYSEKGGAYTKFGDWYGKTVEFDADYSAAPWCDMYLSWAAHKLGYEDWIGQFAWTVRHAEWFKEQGAWGGTPKPGAFVFYDWSGSGEIDDIDHVGIVTKVQGDTIHTIEGNIDGGVAKRKERDTSKVVGYGYPERVKARLDAEAAQKRADEQAAMPARPGTDVGTLQLPGSSLSSLIPHVEQGHRPAPLAAHPKTATGESPRTPTKPTTPDSPDSPAVIPDSSAASPGSSLASSPGTSAAPTSAAGKSSATKPKHAKATTADTTSATAEPLPTHVDASASSSLPTIASPTLVGSALVAALALLALTKTRLRPSLAGARTRAGGSGAEARTRAGGSGAGARTRAGGSRPARGSHAAPGRRRRPASRNTAPRPAPLPERNQPATSVVEAVGGREASTWPLDTAPFVPVFDTGPMVPVSLPAATSAFDAFTPNARPADIGATYRGRRRRSEEPVEGFAPFGAEARPRGRRHRRTGGAAENPWSLNPAGGTSSVDAFLQDVPLRGRRHRAPAEDAPSLVGAGDGGSWSA